MHILRLIKIEKRERETSHGKYRSAETTGI